MSIIDMFMEKMQERIRQKRLVLNPQIPPPPPPVKVIAGIPPPPPTPQHGQKYLGLEVRSRREREREVY